MADDYLTPAQVQEEYGPSTQTLANWRWRGTGPEYVKLSDGRGGRIRYRRSGVERFFAERTVRPGGAAA